MHHQPRNSRGKERSRRRGDIYFQPVPRVAATSSMQGDDEGKGTGSLFPPSASLFRLPYPPPLPLLSLSLPLFFVARGTSRAVFRFLDVFSADPLDRKKTGGGGMNWMEGEICIFER